MFTFLILESSEDLNMFTWFVGLFFVADVVCSQGSILYIKAMRNFILSKVERKTVFSDF